MGKKRQRAKYTSKGQRASMDPRPLKQVRADKSLVDKAIQKLDAFCNGKNVWMTIDNPNPKETNKRKIRVKAHSIYGDFRKFDKGIIMKSEIVEKV